MALVLLRHAVVEVAAVEVVGCRTPGAEEMPPAEVIARSPGSRGRSAGAGSCRRGATCRTCRSCTRRSRTASASVGMPGRRNARPAVTDVAPLRSASRPVSSWPRVGVHIGATWKSVNRTLLVGEAVEVRRLQDRVAGVREVPVSLVVGHDDEDVGPSRHSALCKRRQRSRSGEAQKRSAGVHSVSLLLVHDVDQRLAVGKPLDVLA